MKVRLLLLAFLVLAVGLPAAGQITITSTDVTQAFQAGQTLYSYEDTLTTAVNIGAPGSTSWDFRSLNTNFATTMTSVNPSSTPYYSTDFPTATHALQMTMSMEGIDMTVYQYFTISTNVMNPGRMGGGSFSGQSVVYSLKNSPAATYYALPSTFGTTWNTSYAETYLITLNGLPFLGPTVTNYAESYTVDAYGPMTLPGGTTYQALRIRFEERSPELSVGYIFIAKEGVFVTLSTTDTLATSGVVPVASASFNSPIAVGVSSEQTAPTQFALLQNFPNPFNPSTAITYRLPEASHVRLSVYDLLGREVAVLVNEAGTPGEHTATFDATGLSSGVYVYRLEAGNFVQAQRMLLVR